jgi:hypothetical protein
MATKVESIFAGIKFVIGVPQIKPICNAPDGKQRLRLRSNAAAILRVRTAEGIREFFLADRGDHWAPIYEPGANWRQRK